MFNEHDRKHYVFNDPADGVQKALIRKAATGNAAVTVEDKAIKAEVTGCINFKKITKPEVLVAA